jgi:DNA-binding NarL/FixJ family response regulator
MYHINLTRPPRQRSEITPEERAAIDAAIAEGRVTKCPPGARAWQADNGLVWDWKNSRLVTPVDARKQSHKNGAARGSAVGAEAHRLLSQERQRRAAKMFASGASIEAVAKALDVSIKTAEKYRRARSRHANA